MKKYRFFYTFLKLVSLHVAVNSAGKNRSHFGNFEQSFHNYATVKETVLLVTHQNTSMQQHGQ